MSDDDVFCALELEEKLKKVGLIYCFKSNNEHLLYCDDKGNWWLNCYGKYLCPYNPKIHFKYD